MKEKVLPFIIGLLVGAILATGVFIIYQNNKKAERKEMRGRTPPQMTQSKTLDSNTTSNESANQNSSNQEANNGTPPALPNGEQPTGTPPSDGQAQSTSNTTNITDNN